MKCKWGTFMDTAKRLAFAEVSAQCKAEGRAEGRAEACQEKLEQIAAFLRKSNKTGELSINMLMEAFKLSREQAVAMLAN